MRTKQNKNAIFFNFVLSNASTLDEVKGSAKFRLSEKNTKKFLFLSVRNLCKSSENIKTNTNYTNLTNILNKNHKYSIKEIVLQSEY